MNIKIVLYFLGWVLDTEAAAMVPSLIISLLKGEDVWKWFLSCIVFCAVTGTLLTNKKLKKGNFFVREGYAATALSWLVISLVGALPFYLSGKIPSYVDAVFETASGFTTTGASILSEVEYLGYGLIFWRSFTHWIGGMGVLVLILAIMPMNGGYHMQFMKAESPGPSVSKLVPRVSDTAKALYSIYTGLTVICILSFLISGMPVFDAFCIGVGTAGTGGFSVRDTGMWDYNNVSQALITFWMIAFGVNFNVYYLILRKRAGEALRSEELWFYLGYIAVVIGILTVGTYLNCYRSEGLYYSFHHAAFTVGSLVSSTGFGTVNFAEWPEFLQMLLLLTMFCGASAGSTGGGFKMSRVMILLKQAGSELHLLIHPSSVKPVLLDKKRVEKDTLRSLNNYLVIYFLFFLIAFLIVSLDGYDMKTNFSAVLATLNNIGPGLMKVGPTSNFGFFSVPSKITLIICMIAGRLELLPVLMLFYRKTWAKHY